MRRPTELRPVWAQLASRLRLAGATSALSCFAIAAAFTGQSAAAGLRAHSGRASGAVTISVLSGRADVIAGGEALVSITGDQAAQAVVRLNGRQISSIQPRPNGLDEGIVTNLRLGSNILTAQVPHGGGSAIQITNYPQQGPIFSGPQQQPFYCQNATNGIGGPTDASCSAPVSYSYYYMSTTTGTFEAYDPSSPPSDVATVTTSSGQTVPYIVRVESGVINRGVYRIAVLYDPSGSAWEPWSPQPVWGGKLDLEFGGGCGAGHVMGTLTPSSVLLNTPLSLGYAVASDSLMTQGVDCNAEIMAETAVMLKQHFIDNYGVPKFTVGDGCSGGSLSQNYIATEYPGVLDGLNTQCSFVDINALQWQTQSDCSQLEQYFANNPSGWTTAEMAAVEGRDVTYCNEQYDLDTQNVYNPLDIQGAPWGCSSVIPPSETYNPLSNPGGIRCDWQDDSVNLMGQQPSSVWTAQEQEIGHGFANRPLDNVGVQYGLDALRSGQISLQQFVDLNAGVGGVDIDLNHTAARTQADPEAVSNAYRDGIVTDVRNLRYVPIMSLSAANPATADGHEQEFPYAERARLIATNGTAANQVIWRTTSGLGALSIGNTLGNEEFATLNQWMDNIYSDRSHKPLPAKIIADKPAGLVDECFDGTTQTTLSYCNTTYPVEGTPRTAAGEPFTMDVVKCSLQPLDRSDYPGITDAEWAELKQAFPTGVCNYSKPGQYRPPTLDWLSFANGPDGQPLGPTPKAVPIP